MEGAIHETLMPFGFAHGDGWFDLLWRLCERLEPVVATTEENAKRPFQALQVKEKLGGLRFYVKFRNDAISALIEAAELESFHTCEVCGKPGTRQGEGWITTRCDEHAGETILESLDDAYDEIDFTDIPQWTPAQWSRAARGEAARKILRARVEADRTVWDAFWTVVRPVTQTDAFTRWFAGSKAVTDAEKAEVLFHATASSSNDFYFGQGPVGMEYGERPVAGGETEAVENCSRRGSDHCADLGTGDRRLHSLPIGEGSDQLLRAVWSRKQLGRKGAAHAAFQAEEQVYSTHTDRGRQAGDPIQPRVSGGLREGTRKRKRESSHTCRGQENGRISSGGGPQEAGFRACRGIQSHRGSMKKPS